MIIKKLKAEKFRNIEKCDIDFNPGINILYGDNAQGKTNAVEAMYIFARGKSFRSSEDKELIKIGEEGFKIYIEYEDRNGINSLEYVFLGKERRRKKNGYKLEGVKEMIGNFKAVLFYPDDLLLVKGGPEERRAFLNVAISQCYNEYISYYHNYKKALENRNCLLKFSSKDMYIDENELISWSHYLAEYAAHIYVIRKEYVEKLKNFSEKIMYDISSGSEKLEIFYKSDIKSEQTDLEKIKEYYRQIFTSEIEKEKRAGTTLYGVHRDDLVININGNLARLFASQGQQRSIVLSLKLGEGEVNKSICGEYPVFLFDDVLSELDENRKKYVLEGIGEKQIIITSCENIIEDKKEENKIKVIRGEYKNT